MILILAIFYFVFSLVLFLFSNKSHVANYFLSLYFFLIGLIILNIYSQKVESSDYLEAILLVQCNPIYILAGPILCLYVQMFLCKKYRFRYVDFIHLVPAIFIFINEWPYMILPFSDKLILARLVHLKFENLYNIHLAFVNLKWVILSRYGITLCYIIYAHFLFFRFKQSLLYSKLPHLNRLSIDKWMFSLLFFSLLMCLGTMFGLLTREKLNAIFYLTFTGIAGGVLVFRLLMNPIILYGPTLIKEHDEIILKSIRTLPNVLLSQEQLSSIDGFIEEFLLSRPYIENDFNLNKVSLGLGIPRHHLSYYLKCHLDLSFNTWRDKLRIKYAQELILQGDADTLTLESIGKKAGFQSRDKFARAFKSQTGMNPSDYLKIHYNSTPLHDKGQV
jgi:AraC-like DNA-binding protein